MIDTAFTRSFGITAPVAEAPLAPELALVAAVSNAGGLGLLWTKELDPESVAATVRATRELTDRPFGVNFALDEPCDQQLDAALAEGVAVVTFFWGDPGQYIDRVHAAGALVTLTVGSAAEARRAAELGVDAVVAHGNEAGATSGGA